MHKKNIAHRDIKPENILMESKEPSNINLKITDFGFAKCYDPREGGLTETLGSPLYMAPEIIKKQKYNEGDKKNRKKRVKKKERKKREKITLSFERSPPSFFRAKRREFFFLRALLL